MATASVTNTFVNGTTADADEVNTNFQNLVDFVNQSVLHRDGSNVMTGDLDLNSNKIDNPLAVAGRLSRSTGQSLSLNTWTQVDWDAQDFATGGMGASLPSNYLSPTVGGVYLIHALVSVDSNLFLGLRLKSGSNVVATNYNIGDGDSILSRMDNSITFLTTTSGSPNWTVEVYSPLNEVFPKFFFAARVGT